MTEASWRRGSDGAARRWINPAFGVLNSALLLASCSLGGPVELKMVVPRLPIDQEIAEDFAELLDGGNGIAVRLVASPDPNMSGAETLADGLADIALVSNNEHYRAGVATVLPLYPTVLHVVHRAGESITEPEDLLRGHSIFAGPPGSVSREVLEQAAVRFGVAAEEIRYVDGEACPDVFVVYAPVLPNLPDRVERCGDYRMLSLGDPEAIGKGSSIDSLLLFNPRLRPFVVPVGAYGDLTPEPIVTVAVDRLLVARADLTEAVVYDLISEIFRMKPALAATHPGLFHRLTDAFDASSSTFVLHAGARAFLDRNEPDVYERYSGIAEVLVTLLIGLVSGTYAVLRIYNIRRKNRIDTFYEEALAIRRRADLASNPAARRAALADLLALQNRAFDMLIDEKLAADESFRIFVALSNDVRDELRANVPEAV